MISHVGVNPIGLPLLSRFEGEHRDRFYDLKVQSGIARAPVSPTNTNLTNWTNRGKGRV